MVNMGLDGQLQLRLDRHLVKEVKATIEEIYGGADTGNRKGPRPAFSQFAGHLIGMGLDDLRRRRGTKPAAASRHMAG